MKKYNFLHALWMSFYSNLFYRDALKNWKGIGAAYLFFLIFLINIPTAVSIHIGVKTFAQDELPRLLDQMPKIKVQEGHLVTPEDQTYTIRDPESGNIVGIINPEISQKIDNPEESPYFILEKQQIIIKQNSHETRTYSLSTFGNIELNKEAILKYVELFRPWVVVVLYPFILVYNFAVKLLIGLFWGLLLLIIGKGMRANLTYQHSLRLAIVAMTPAILLNEVDFWLDLNLSATNSYFYAILTLLYIFIVAYFIRQKPKQA